MYTSQQSTDFNQRVDLGNSYCNCFHLMCRVEKSTWYIFLKRALLSWYTVCSAPVSTWKYSDLKTLSFSTRPHTKNSCVVSSLYWVHKDRCRVKRKGAITNFNQRIGLRNSYCNWSHLMHRVEKVPDTPLCIRRDREQKWAQYAWYYTVACYCTQK